MTDLAAFLEAVRRAPADHTARLALADWLDDRYPAAPVAAGRLPKGFNRWWHHRLLGWEWQIRFGYQRPDGASGTWSNAEVLAALAAVIADDRGTLFDGGASEVAGYPVLAFEPRLGEAAALDLCAQLQERLGCPVTLNRLTADPTRSVRVTAWFTAVPSDLVLAAEAIARAAFPGGSARTPNEFTGSSSR